MVQAVRVFDDAIEVDLVMRAACPGCPAGVVARASTPRVLQAFSGRPVWLTILPLFNPLNQKSQSRGAVLRQSNVTGLWINDEQPRCADHQQRDQEDCAEHRA